MLGEYRTLSVLRGSKERQLDLACALFLAVGSFSIYVITAVPGVFDGDHGEFQYMARLLGLPHPTGYPLYLLLGWLWSWLPLGTLAFRMNIFSAFWAALTVGGVFAVARRQGSGVSGALGGAVALALSPAFWRYAGLAAVYTLNTMLVVVSLGCWLRWAEGPKPFDRRWFWAAAFSTGLALTNHPTGAFLVPSVALLLVSHWARSCLRRRHSSPQQREDALGMRSRLNEFLVAAVLFVLPGLLYLYVPLRLWAIGPGIENHGLLESIAKGRVAPSLDWTLGSIPRYITGSDYIGRNSINVRLPFPMLSGLLRGQFGLVLAVLGVIGSVLWLVRRPRSWVLLSSLFLLSAFYALGYYAAFAARGEVVHLEGFLMPAFLVFSLWIARGINYGVSRASKLLRRELGHAQMVTGLAMVLLVFALTGHLWANPPTSLDRARSQSIDEYWTEVLSYPLEQDAAVTAHWGDLTAFWYFQNGEGKRSDLWTISPPNTPEIETWIAGSGKPVYLAGPLLDWSSDLDQRFNLTPWGALVRIDERNHLPPFPSLKARSELFGGQLQLEGYYVERPDTGRWRLGLAWRTVGFVSRDLSISVRLHAPSGALLVQKDGRLASLWYPEDTMPPEQSLLTIVDFDYGGRVLPNAVLRIVVYDPETMRPLLTSDGWDVYELGPLAKD
jgi:hypothetical protein